MDPLIIILLLLLVVIALGILLAMIAIFHALPVSKTSKDEKIFSAFIRSLMRAEEIESCVLSLPCNPAIASAVGLRISPAETNVRFVIREEYVTLWKRLDTKFKAEGAKESIVIGTSGIGKSMFRFYILREWLFERINVGCEFVVLNLDETFYLIDRKGNAKRVPHQEISRFEVLALLDPCELLSGQQTLRFGFLIVTTSPSPLVGQSIVCSLTQLTKYATIYPMKAWNGAEVQKGMPNVDPKRLEMFCYKDVAGVEYFVPRWLLYSDGDIEARLEESLTADAQNGLITWFESNPDEKCKGCRLPYRLCVIGEDKGNWVACGFISKYVGMRALKWALAGASVDRRTLLNLLRNPWSRGLVGNIFEQWAFEGISHGRVLDVQRMVRMSSNAPEKKHSVAEKFTFKAGLSYFHWTKEHGRYSVEDIELENHKMYKASVSNFGSIEGYGRVDNNLFLIQTTVSPNHSPAQWDHVASIVTRAYQDVKKKQLVIFLVYLVPKLTTFSIPTCPSFKGRTGFICTGMVENDDFESRFFDPTLLGESLTY
jgi:hypothetical protein